MPISLTPEPPAHGQPSSKANAERRYFKTQSAFNWLAEAKETPVPKMLLGPLWFEGELCIFFADTNTGKSVLAVQIANAISKGKQIGPLKLESPKCTVLYFDFELSSKQFEARYAERDDEFFTNHYDFDEQFLRSEMDPDGVCVEGFNTPEDAIIRSIENEIVSTEAKVVIVDNLTFLGTDSEKAKNASQLMKQLKALKSKYSLSMLVLAHTPKRPAWQKLTPNDLQGSKMLMNFADSAFAIAKSSEGETIRYLKQIKERNSEKVYHDGNVLVWDLTKSSNFLEFKFLKTDTEIDHLSQPEPTDRDLRERQVRELRDQGRSYREITAELGISLGTVSKILGASE